MRTDDAVHATADLLLLASTALQRLAKHGDASLSSHQITILNEVTDIATRLGEIAEQLKDTRL